MDMTSVTLDEIGATNEIQNSGEYTALKPKLMQMNREIDSKRMQEMGAAPDYVIGSVHAVTEQGEVIIASMTGSQLPAYAFGANKVIWVIGTQKIVSNMEQGMKRLYEYTLPLESERAKIAYGVPGSSVNKILIINQEINPERIKVIFVNEALGY